MLPLRSIVFLKTPRILYSKSIEIWYDAQTFTYLKRLSRLIVRILQEQTATAGTTKLIDDFDVCFRDQILKFGGKSTCS